MNCLPTYGPSSLTEVIEDREGILVTQDTLVQSQIVTVLRDRFHLSESVLESSNWDKPLTGRLFNLSGMDLVCLLFELERAFAVRVPEQHLDTYGFCSIENIAEAIRGCRGD